MDRELIHHLARLYGSEAQDRSGNVHIRCPLAATLKPDGLPAHRNGEDRHNGLSVKITPDGPSVCHCFGCGSGGSLLAVFNDASELLGGPFTIAFEFVKENDKGGLVQALARLRKGPDDGKARRKAPSDLDRYVANCSRFVPTYLTERRGVIRSDVERWKIGFDPELSPAPWKGHAGAAVFPVWQEDGKLVGCARRTIHDGVEPRFFDTPGVWKSEVFYGEHAIDRTLEHAYIVEGVLGTVFAARVLPNTLGILGAINEIGDVRLAKLRRWCSRLTLVLDNDNAGRAAVDGKFDPKGNFIPGLRQTLRHEFVVKVVRLPTEFEGRKTKDPADIPSTALVEAVKKAEYLK